MSSKTDSASSSRQSHHAYIAVIGDIVHSRQITDRKSFQKGLAESLAELSGAQPGIASPWTITLGDEMQALYSHTDGLIYALWRIQQIIYPHHIRFAIGIGRIDTAINSDAALGMDGPAFHHAREGIEALKEDDQRSFAIRSDNEDLKPSEDVLNLAALTIYGGRGQARLDLAVELLAGRGPTDIGGSDSSEVRRLQKLRQEAGLQIVVDALDNVAHAISRSCQKLD